MNLPAVSSGVFTKEMLSLFAPWGWEYNPMRSLVFGSGSIRLINSNALRFWNFSLIDLNLYNNPGYN